MIIFWSYFFILQITLWWNFPFELVEKTLFLSILLSLIAMCTHRKYSIFFFCLFVSISFQSSKILSLESPWFSIHIFFTGRILQMCVCKIISLLPALSHTNFSPGFHFLSFFLSFHNLWCSLSFFSFFFYLLYLIPSF